MKGKIKYLFLVLAVILLGGYVYWNQHKKAIIKDKIQDTVNKKTDSLYYLHYDSSAIDEINGNASFYHVSLQSDSAQKEMLKDTDSLPNALFNITVEELTATGIDVPGLLKNQDVSANSVLLINPVVHIINTGKDKPKEFVAADTMALYKKILGRFSTIKASHITIKNGTILITSVDGKSLTTLENINVDLNNFLVDSTRDYESIISYFINEVKVTVENIQLPESPNKTRINLVRLRYDATDKILEIGGIQQYNVGNTQPIINLKNIVLSGLNTSSFIRSQQLKAGSLSCDGGLITIAVKEKQEADKNSPIQFSSDLIDEMEVGTVKLGKTKLIVINPARPAAAPFILNDVSFTVSKIQKITQGSLLNNIVNNSEWQFQSSGFSFFTKDKLYKLSVSGIDIDNATAVANIKSMVLSPQLSETEFMKRKSFQVDRYDLKFRNIRLQQINVKKILAENKIEIAEVFISPEINIYRDRTMPGKVQNKMGKYPHQLLQKMKTPIFLKSVFIKNGYICYKEKGKESARMGSVIFDKVDARIDNVTNIDEKVKINPECTVNANTLFLGVARLNTIWKLPLTPSDTTFHISGQMEGMNALILNQLTEPLGMVSVKSGEIKNLQFAFTANDHSSNGEVLFLYNDLRIELLKKNEADEMTGKDGQSFIANLLIKNNNPQNGNTRKGIIDFKRDETKSFFNVVWKSIFDGVKKTAGGK